MKVLVTGGAGFIGTNLTRRLLKNSYEVICIDNFDDYYSPLAKRNNLKEFSTCNRFESVEGDIRNKELLMGIE
ncbi:GDP-mannose 4,6-dehydratase [Sphingobacterium hotanense]|uniref:GDP-mannose 4,6-dehydratase n=1 Tax=Sphingobacterium hotanense TaxID=649196 RepID=UPI0021A585A1|nr:GDP-mannose 4,6-dehydratase [Sphingobacterium hotanense]MCT1525052.1 GDP-mannose 4,6-dehydratase [Sphingobacterium hotanense]